MLSAEYNRTIVHYTAQLHANADAAGHVLLMIVVDWIE